MPEAQVPENDFGEALDVRLARLWFDGVDNLGSLHTELKRGQLVALFRIRALLGRGAFGYVYSALDIRLWIFC